MKVHITEITFKEGRRNIDQDAQDAVEAEVDAAKEAVSVAEERAKAAKEAAQEEIERAKEALATTVTHWQYLPALPE